MKQKLALTTYQVAEFEIVPHMHPNTPRRLAPHLVARNGRNRPRRTKPLALVLVLVFGVLCAGVPQRLCAQEDVLPLAANVDQLRVNVYGPQVPAIYARINDTQTRMISAITFKNVEMKQNGGCVLFTDPSGRLRLPTSTSPAYLLITLSDFLLESSARSNLLAALREQAELGPLMNFQMARVSPGRTARLVIPDLAANGRRRLLAEGNLIASTTPEPIATLSLGPDEITALQGLQAQVPNPARLVSLLIEQDCEVSFRTIDVELNLDFVENSLADLSQRLVPYPDGRRPQIVLAGYTPMQLSPSGELDNATQFAKMLREFVRIDVFFREGSQPNLALVEKLLDEVLKLINLRIEISEAERQQAIVTVVLDEGVQITATLPKLRELAAAIQNDWNRTYSSAFKRAIQHQTTTTFGGEVGATIGFFGTKANGSWSDSWNDQTHAEKMKSNYAKALTNIAVQLEGGYTVLPGIRYDLNYRVGTIDFASIRANVGNFKSGKWTVETELPLSDFVEILQQAPRVEALLVNKTEVGIISSGPSSSWQRTGDVRFVQIPVTFPKPFATAPKVVTAICELSESKNGSSSSEVRSIWNHVMTEAIDITPDRFTLRIAVSGGWTGYGSIVTVTNVVASWTAVGQTALGSATAGGLAILSGAPPLISREVREAALTPQVQFQLKNGVFGASFNAVPGRYYDIQASTNLMNWTTVGGTGPTDALATLELADVDQWPFCFFRIFTP